MLHTTIPDNAMTTFLDDLDQGNRGVLERYPGERPHVQPVHTVYGGAHLFQADTVQKLGAIALRTLREHAPDADTLAGAIGIERDIAERILPRIVDKLHRDPVEDFRIDFEDGFGHRPDDEEDRYAVDTAREVASAAGRGILPHGIGIRIKPFGEELKRRSLRTFDLFLTALLEATAGKLPANFVVTLPKITAPEQVAALASACDAFEYWREIPHGTLRFELMIETTQSVIAADGTLALPRLIAQGRGRITAAHFGAYDYTAACNITAAHQDMLHPACDFARHVMQVTLAGTGIWLSDGATNIMPVGPHRTTADRDLTAAQRAENTRAVHRAWRLHADHIRHSLRSGFYQGWDLHPAQLPSRYATVYAFFVEGSGRASERLRHFVEQAAQATIVGDVFDDAATGQGLLNYFLRAMNCGAISENEAVEMSGLTTDELRGRSFARILAKRRKPIG
ncbi:MAG: phosphoenolpyruvate kinase [Blastocatellia bacterium]|nr:MAG: phosphoenolpyruvate kinase [Blastocatellia bacterium]